MIIIVDTETTGLKHYESAIIEIGAVKLDENYDIKREFEHLCNPGLQYLDRDEFYPSGIKMSDLLGAESSYEIAHKFKRWMGEDFDKVELWAFNTAFDKQFLNMPPWDIPYDYWGGCVMLRSQKLMWDILPNNKYGKKWPKLSEAREFFKIEHENNHRALDDVIVTAEIFKIIMESEAVK